MILCNNKTVVETAFGRLEMFQTGQVGGRSECHEAILIPNNSYDNLPEEVLLAVAKVFDLNNGDCVNRVSLPYKHHVRGYKWCYWPSTD